jgi:hypothetical protein
MTRDEGLFASLDHYDNLTETTIYGDNGQGDVVSQGKIAITTSNSIEDVYHVQGLVSYGPPWAHNLDGYQDRLLGGPLDSSTWITRHLMAWGARTTVEEYSDRKLCMSCTMQRTPRRI